MARRYDRPVAGSDWWSIGPVGDGVPGTPTGVYDEPGQSETEHSQKYDDNTDPLKGMQGLPEAENPQKNGDQDVVCREGGYDADRLVVPVCKLDDNHRAYRKGDPQERVGIEKDLLSLPHKARSWALSSGMGPCG